MHPLLIKQDNLHSEATELLEEIIYPLLKDFGEINVGGSYSYKLLSQPDIDVDIINPNLNKESYVSLCSKLISLPEVSKFQTNDRVNYPQTQGRPTGYWISPTINFGKNVWKLDIWFQKPEWSKGETNRYSQKLASLIEEDRISILSLKEALISEGVYGVGKEFQSVDVYDAILQGVKTVDGLRGIAKT
ncbi:MAG: hypothetical protein ABL917_00555 [Parcubacteria group bacterium]